MQYKNKKTGVIIEIKSNLDSEYWEPVEAPKPTRKKKEVKDDGLRNDKRP